MKLSSNDISLSLGGRICTKFVLYLSSYSQYSR